MEEIINEDGELYIKTPITKEEVESKRQALIDLNVSNQTSVEYYQSLVEENLAEIAKYDAILAQLE